MTPAHVAETMKFMAGLRLGPLSRRHSPDIATKLSTTDELDLTESAVKEDPATQPPPLQAAPGAGGRQGGGTYLRPKDSNAAVGVRDRATGKALVGADRQIDFPRIIVRL